MGGAITGTWSRGSALLIHSLNVFRQYPSFLVPILAVWAVYAPTVVYLKYGYRWGHHRHQTDLEVLFLVIFGLSFLLLMSCAVVMEMIRQIELGNPSFLTAVTKAFSKDVASVLLLSIVWAIIWFVLTLLEAALSRRGQRTGDDRLTAQGAAETIANFRDFSFSAAFIDALQKGVRMVAFLIVPAICWENLGFVAAVKKGLAVLRAHLGDFASGYALTYAAAAVIFLPPATIFELGTGRHGGPPPMHFPQTVWVGVIIYMGFAWSFSIYLEQMFMAQLYLWNMKWEEAVAAAKARGDRAPEFSSVPRPELLAKTPGLFV